MIKAGIFLDSENLSRCGGWGMNVEQIRKLVEAQGATIIRANAYMAVDEERERDPNQRAYTIKKQRFRDAIRRAGFHVVRKPVTRFHNEDGEVQTKANADIDLAVDALLQSEQLDYILLGTGDGDFIRLVRALQNRGKRVDLLAFSFVSGKLRREVDYFFDGYLVPALLPSSRKYRGGVHTVEQDRGFCFVQYFIGFRPEETAEMFLHIRDLEAGQLRNEEFAELKRARDTYIEFDVQPTAEGRTKAIDACVFRPF